MRLRPPFSATAAAPLLPGGGTAPPAAGTHILARARGARDAAPAQTGVADLGRAPRAAAGSRPHRPTRAFARPPRPRALQTPAPLRVAVPGTSGGPRLPPGSPAARGGAFHPAPVPRVCPALRWGVPGVPAAAPVRQAWEARSSRPQSVQPSRRRFRVSALGLLATRARAPSATPVSAILGPGSRVSPGMSDERPEERSELKLSGRITTPARCIHKEKTGPPGLPSPVTPTTRPPGACGFLCDVVENADHSGVSL